MTGWGGQRLDLGGDGGGGKVHRGESVGVYVGVVVKVFISVYTLLGLSVRDVNAWRGAVKYLCVKG